MAEISEEQIELWVEMLKEFPFTAAQKNLKEYILSNHFPPVIADIVRQDPDASQNLLQQETENRFLKLAQWEQAATSMPLHLKRGDGN